MKRVIALQHSSGRVLGVDFKQEVRGKVYVGVAVVDDKAAQVFEDREDFEVEDLDASEVSNFPADFPLLAPQKSALVKAGLDDLAKLRAYDFGQKIRGISDTTVAAIQKYLAEHPE